jgi:RimJ/RimL family protein N-acetyltransferase
MDRAFLQAQTAAIRAGIAATLGCDEAAFEGEQLTVVDRPDPPAWPYTAILATFGVGTVVSILPELRDFAASRSVEEDYFALQPRYLSDLVAEAASRGQTVTAGSPALLWALADPPPERAVPDGLALRRMDPEWMARHQQAGHFRNAVGRSVSRGGRNYYAYALLDPAGEPAAIAGVFRTYGLHEIGVDVLRPHRGRGLANVVVSAAARAILEEGNTPLYGCGADNTRSQRTALACGFIPVASDATIA